MRCVHSIHFICKISFIHHILLFMVQDQQGLQVKSGIVKTAGWNAFHQPSCSCSWFHLQVLVNFYLKNRFNVTTNNSFLFCPRCLAQVGCMKVSQLKSSVQKLFRSNKLSSHLYTINACGACIITVVRRS